MTLAVMKSLQYQDSNRTWNCRKGNASSPIYCFFRFITSTFAHGAGSHGEHPTMIQISLLYFLVNIMDTEQSNLFLP